jgi:uncharacterized RDD family membrane protein YckC
MFCSRCGKDVQEGTRYCQNCGQEVGVVAPAAQSTAASPARAIAPGALSYGGFWLRLVAHLIDSVILGIPLGLVAMVLFFLFGGFGLMMHRNTVDSHAAAAFVAPIFFGILFAMFFLIGLYWLYFAGMESSERQATFGKAAMSLRVTDLEGRRLTFGHATGRFFAKIITGMIPLGIGYFMAGFTEKKQALHDMIAGTLVLQKL